MKRNHTVQTGDIFVCSWGYNQTNIDFFKITELIGKSMVRVVEIGSTLENSDRVPDTGTCRPNPDVEVGNTFRKRVGGDNGYYLALDFGRYAFPWDGKPRRWTRYA